MDAAEDARDLVFVDLETTGGSPAYDRVIEVGIVRQSWRGETLDVFCTLVNPGRSIPANIESFTGIGNVMVQAAPSFADLAEMLREKLANARFVAHNARFDYSFLRREFARLQTEFSAEVICTVRLSRRLYPQFPRHNLDALLERHKVRCLSRHRALGDAEVIRDLWAIWRAEHAGFEGLLASAILRPPKLPAHLPSELVDILPETPGIYRYYGEGDTLLYVGKCTSLRAKVLQQLGGEQEGSRDHRLAGETRRVEWQQTAGELGAMLREAAAVMALKPRYNRRSKDHAASVTLRILPGGQVQTVRLDDVDAAELAETFGLFHRAGDARKALQDIAAAKGLCLKRLGLEESEGSCLAYQWEKCRGVCVGKESPPLHDMRLRLALAALKIKRWPFPGRIALREHASHGDEVHLLDQWAYLGSAQSDEEFETLAIAGTAPVFDVDVYKILVKYFTHHTKLDWRDVRAS